MRDELCHLFADKVEQPEMSCAVLSVRSDNFDDLCCFFITQYKSLFVCKIISTKGLTCNELNFVQKGGFQRLAEELDLIVVCPDTSPRGVEGLNTDNFSWDFGYGAGFYVDATEENYKKNFRMYSYITRELIKTIEENFPASSEKSIMGHSMGGHGALVSRLWSLWLRSHDDFHDIWH